MISRCANPRTFPCWRKCLLEILFILVLGMDLAGMFPMNCRGIIMITCLPAILLNWANSELTHLLYIFRKVFTFAEEQNGYFTVSQAGISSQRLKSFPNLFKKPAKKES